MLRRIDSLVALDFLTSVPEAVNILGAARRKRALDIAISWARTAICNVRADDSAPCSGSNAYVGKKGIQEHAVLSSAVAEDGC